MDDKNQIIEILKVLVPIVSSIIGLLPITIKQNSFRKKRFLIFKDIRKEYLKDKVNGYYYFQSFLNIRLPKKEIDHILKSPDAFAIMKIIRVCQGNYEFDKNTNIAFIDRETLLKEVAEFKLFGLTLDK